METLIKVSYFWLGFTSAITFAYWFTQKDQLDFDKAKITLGCINMSLPFVFLSAGGF